MAENVFSTGHAVNGQWHETGSDLQKTGLPLSPTGPATPRRVAQDFPCPGETLCKRRPSLQGSTHSA
jgi:hypothetical protein